MSNEKSLVAEARELLSAVTPWPWAAKQGDRCWHVGSLDGTFETACIMFAGGKGTSEGNAAFIARAPELTSALCDEVDRLRSQFDRLCNHASHADDCEWWGRIPRTTCTCGLADLVTPKGSEQ